MDHIPKLHWLTMPDLALQVGEEEAGVGQGGVGGAVVGVVLAPRLLKKSSISFAPMLLLKYTCKPMLASTTGLLQRVHGLVVSSPMQSMQGRVELQEEKRTQVLTSSNLPRPKCVTWVQAELSRQS